MDLRIHFDDAKDRQLQRERGLSMAGLADIFNGPYLISRRQDDPEQWRAIGWAQGRLCSLVYEEREDSDGPYCHLVTGWKATQEECHAYQKACP